MDFHLCVSQQRKTTRRGEERWEENHLTFFAIGHAPLPPHTGVHLPTTPAPLTKTWWPAPLKLPVKADALKLPVEAAANKYLITHLGKPD